MDKNLPFHPARKTSVNIDPGLRGKTDVYVDDISTIAIDKEDNLERIIKAPIILIHAVADSAQFTSESIKRKKLVADDKMQAEGAAGEEKICLGCILNIRLLLMKLSIHKATAWKSQIDNVLTRDTVSNKDLQSILGRLENAAQVMVPLGHFLSNIRHMQMIAEQKGHNIRLNELAKDGLHLAKRFLNKAQQGVSMNLLTFRITNTIYTANKKSR